MSPFCHDLTRLPQPSGFVFFIPPQTPTALSANITEPSPCAVIPPPRPKFLSSCVAVACVLSFLALCSPCSFHFVQGPPRARNPSRSRPRKSSSGQRFLSRPRIPRRIATRLRSLSTTSNSRLGHLTRPTLIPPMAMVPHLSTSRPVVRGLWNLEAAPPRLHA